jgi:uncharacterized protein involved in exopolysaccharide biosynthesis
MVMKQVFDSRGNPLKGIFKKDDGSIVNKNESELVKNLKQHNTFERLNNQIQELMDRLARIESFLKIENKQ